MKTKLTVFMIPVLLLAAGVVMSNFIGRAQQITDEQNTKQRGTIDWYVQNAKAQGRRQVIVPAPIPIYSMVKDSDDALSRFSMVVAQPVAKKTYQRDKSSFVTWYKFKILDTLSQPTTPECPACLNELNAPNDMLPIQTDEILVSVPGGTLMVDGVEVVNKETGILPLSISQPYLLVLSLDVARQIGMLNMGPSGIFTIKPDGVLEPVFAGESPLKSELKVRWDNSLERFKSSVQNRRNNYR